MVEKLGHTVINYLIRQENIDQRDKDIYLYGIETLFINSINFMVIGLIAVILGQLLELIVLLIFFVPLRSLVGGYHAKTSLNCLILSNSVIAITLFLFRYPPEIAKNYLGIYLFIITSGIAALLAPVENSQKLLDEEERKIYGKYARILIAVEVAIGLIFYRYSNFQYFWLLTLIILLITVTEIVGILHNQYTR